MAKPKIVYDPDGSVVLDNIEWTWESLKHVCHSDFVFEGKPRGFICRKYKLPRDILNEWIESENWEYDRKSHWQRPYSYRIDSALNNLMINISHLVEIQEEVNDIEFDEKNILSRIKIDIQAKENDQWKIYKTLILEKYAVLIEGIGEYIGSEKIKILDDTEEIKYKAQVSPGEILIRYLKEKGKIKNPQN
ncbi:hypothetical protein C900_03877 [Fulvivirga imtechensis AK7]|uniref:Uncharacterized protein n=1 Tax=Fulvivirga imtechensis AK7 TaxID=1237149 RepID=L8JS43_9BACT|nr:hypothetical protein [Fulvivirga imtechensis]ELR70192.1 hypothetical protein C900_03877 [Fulvivirga imtechensis AK7]